MSNPSNLDLWADDQEDEVIGVNPLVENPCGGCCGCMSSNPACDCSN